MEIVWSIFLVWSSWKLKIPWRVSSIFCSNEKSDQTESLKKLLECRKIQKHYVELWAPKALSKSPFEMNVCGSLDLCNKLNTRKTFLLNHTIKFNQKKPDSVTYFTTAFLSKTVFQFSTSVWHYFCTNCSVNFCNLVPIKQLGKIAKCEQNGIDFWFFDVIEVIDWKNCCWQICKFNILLDNLMKLDLKFTANFSFWCYANKTPSWNNKALINFIFCDIFLKVMFQLSLQYFHYSRTLNNITEK